MARARRKIHSLDDLTPDPQNPNKGTARGQQLLGASLKHYGAGRSVLADRHGVVLAGNKTLEEAKALGLGVRVVETTGEELVVVQRTNLDLATDPNARQLALADNRIGEVNLDWDPALLAGFAANGLDLTSLWTPKELEMQGVLHAEPGRTPDDAVVPLKETTIQPGDLFELGGHRLLCGDATDAVPVGRLLGEDRPTLLITDPPYGVQYGAIWRVRAGQPGRHAVGPVTNDDRVDWRAAFALFPGDVAYIFHAALHAAEVADAITSCGFDLRAQIIWAKTHFVLGRGEFHWQHEPAWYAVRRGRPSGWCGDRAQSTLWSIPNLNPFSGGHDEENAVTGHSTQKPVALYERALRCNSAPHDVLMDAFAGSGTAFIAAEKLGRRCLGLELEPRYVQVILDRWTAYTGGGVRKVDTRSAGTQG